ncbi:ABC transporter substrate-binding protein [Hymenobacter daeguensis]
MKFYSLIRYTICLAALLLAGGCNSRKPAPADAIHIRWAHDPETLDPLSLHNQAAIDAYNLLNISLLQADAATQELAPALAEALPSIRLLNDSTTGIGYRIRNAAAWDSGRPILASDVVFTLKLLFCPGLPNEAAQSQYRFIRAVQATANDPRRFAFLCRGRSIEYAQTTGDLFILPEAELDPRGWLRRFDLADFQRHRAEIALDTGIKNVVRRYQAANASRTAQPLPGCGAYQLVKWEKDRYAMFRRKPHWWADDVHPAPLVLQAQPRQLTYSIIPAAATATLALQNGSLDVYPQMPAREFARLGALPAAAKTLRFYTSESHDVLTAGFNTRHPALADALTRRALGQCFDAAGLLHATQLDQGQRTVGIISPNDHLNYNDSLRPVPFAPTGAAALLRLAGWLPTRDAAAGWTRTTAQGQRQQLRLRLRYRAGDELFSTTALQFQAAAASIGVPVQLLPTEPGMFSQALRSGDFDVYLRMIRGNPFMFNFTAILHTAGIGADNVTGFSLPACDRLIEAIAAADSKPHRARLLHRFQALMQEQAPLVPLFFLPNRVAANKRLDGLHVNSLKPGYSALTLAWAAPPAP